MRPANSPQSRRPSLRRIVVGLLLSVASTSMARAESVADFYRGKTVTVEVGYGPGGGYDLTARLFAQFFGRHIPGHPNVVVENVPGGGGLKVANAIFNTVPKDGLTLGVFSSDVVLQPLYGEPQAHFRPNEFGWIGSMDTDVQSCGVWKGAGSAIKTLPDLIAAKSTITFGSSSPGTDPSLYPLFFKNALGAPVKVINGYTGTREIVLAMKRGEIAATCGLFESSVRSSYMQDIKDGNLTIFVQITTGQPSPLFSGATLIPGSIRNNDLRESAELIFGPSLLTRPLAAPPGIPPERLEALRAALIATAADPAAIEAGQKMRIGLQPKSGEEVESMIRKFQSTPPDIVKRAYAYTHDGAD